MNGGLLSEYVRKYDGYRRLADEIGMPRTRAEQILEEALVESMNSPDITFLAAIERASKRIVLEQMA